MTTLATFLWGMAGASMYSVLTLLRRWTQDLHLPWLPVVVLSLINGFLGGVLVLLVGEGIDGGVAALLLGASAPALLIALGGATNFINDRASRRALGDEADEATVHIRRVISGLSSSFEEGSEVRTRMDAERGVDSVDSISTFLRSREMTQPKGTQGDEPDEPQEEAG